MTLLHSSTLMARGDDYLTASACQRLNWPPTKPRRTPTKTDQNEILPVSQGLFSTFQLPQGPDQRVVPQKLDLTNQEHRPLLLPLANSLTLMSPVYVYKKGDPVGVWF
ncbi:hypothetical protein Bbelb_402470 [Branchiostoma belcheri]|nr:hypothetical protein Bbelb_402470 [Branchiostoma belcheri]